jgi:hypothetical protein
MRNTLERCRCRCAHIAAKEVMLELDESPPGDWDEAVKRGHDPIKAADAAWGKPQPPDVLRFGSAPSTDVPLIQSSEQFTEAYVPPDYLIDGFLQRRYVYGLTARTGTGKTAIALYLAALVALGRPLGDREVEQGRVLIFAGENPDDVRARWIAMSQNMDFDDKTIDVHFIPGRFKVSELIERIRTEVQVLGGVALVVIDTSAAYFEGTDENDNVQAGAHAARMRSLGLPGGPCTIINCHPTKNATDDNLQPRGGGAFVAEIDGNLTARKDDMIVELHWQVKYRGPDFAPMSFLLRTVTHGRLKDSKGRLISTVIAELLSEKAQEELAKVARTDENLLLKAIDDNEGASVSDLAKALGWYTGKNAPYKSKVHRAISRLKEAKLLTVERGAYSLTEKGSKVLKRLSE